MSKSTTVTFGDRGFWSFADAFGVWLAYLAEAIEEHGDQGEPWFQDLVRHLRASSAVTDPGLRIPKGSDEQISRLRAIAETARQQAVSRGSLSEDELRAWLICDDLPVSGAFSRTGTEVEIERVLEVADAFLALLDGALPKDPPNGAWMVGIGEGYHVVPYKGDLAEDAPRFPRGAE